MALLASLHVPVDSPTDAMSETTGRFIVFEGGDGSGKSTQARLLADRLGAVLTREPGGTRVGAMIRSIVLDPALTEIADRTEALLMAADRAQHVEECIRPALLAGQHVVSDRHVASSLAYQGVGRGLGIDVVAAVNDFAVGDVRADLVVLLDVDIHAARNRLGDDLDRIEHAGTSLANDVVTTYRALAAADPGGWVVIDATGDVDQVALRVNAAVEDRLGL